jgi:hypothetical protein
VSRIRWTSAEGLRAAFFLAFLTSQIAIPAVRLWSPRPSRFGWHMFVGHRVPDFSVVRRDGSVSAVKLGDYLGEVREELEGLSTVLPPAICGRDRHVVTVRVTIPLETTTYEYRCAQ